MTSSDICTTTHSRHRTGASTRCAQVAPSGARPGRRSLHGSLRSLLVALATALLVAFSATAPASAHDELVSSTPSQGETLEKAPETLELTYSGNILNMGHEIRVTDSTGRDVTRGTTAVKDKTVSQPLNDGGTADETYTVTWRVVSQDGHPIEGTFTYSVGEGAGRSAAPQPVSSASEFGHSHEDHSHAPEATQAPASQQDDAGMPGWVLPVIGGVVALAVLCVVLMVATRPKKR